MTGLLYPSIKTEGVQRETLPYPEVQARPVVQDWGNRPATETISKTFTTAQSFKICSFRIREEKVAELTRDAKELQLSVNDYINKIVFFSFYVNYPTIKRSVSDYLKKSKKFKKRTGKV